MDSTHTISLSSIILLKNYLRIFARTVEPLPKELRLELEDKVKQQKIQISELEALVSELQKRIYELLNSDNVTDEIKSLVDAGKIDEAENRVDEIIAATITEQQQKLGDCYFQQGKVKEIKLKYKEAYEAFKQAVNCQPENTVYLNYAGLSGVKVADYEQAQLFF